MDKTQTAASRTPSSPGEEVQKAAETIREILSRSNSQVPSTRGHTQTCAALTGTPGVTTPPITITNQSQTKTSLTHLTTTSTCGVRSAMPTISENSANAQASWPSPILHREETDDTLPPPNDVIV